MNNFIIPTTFALHLANSVARRTKNFQVLLPGLSKDKKRRFPDGEVYMRILAANKLRDKRVIVLHAGAARPNEGLVELELILQILRDNLVRPEVFFSYFAYGMQDSIFLKGETNVAENLIEKLINFYRVRKIYTIDAHFWGRKWIKKYPITNVSAVPYLMEKAKNDFGKGLVFLSPDIGGKRRTGISGMKKKRINSRQTKIIRSRKNLKGKTAAVVDDLSETGGTLLKAYDWCKKNGAKQVIALITHGVLSSGISKIKKQYSKLYLTNTIKQKEANVDITDLISKALSEL